MHRQNLDLVIGNVAEDDLVGLGIDGDPVRPKDVEEAEASEGLVEPAYTTIRPVGQPGCRLVGSGTFDGGGRGVQRGLNSVRFEMECAMLS